MKREHNNFISDVPCRARDPAFSLTIFRVFSPGLVLTSCAGLGGDEIHNAEPPRTTRRFHTRSIGGDTHGAGG